MLFNSARFMFVRTNVVKQMNWCGVKIIDFHSLHSKVSTIMRIFLNILIKREFLWKAFLMKSPRDVAKKADRKRVYDFRFYWHSFWHTLQHTFNCKIASYDIIKRLITTGFGVMNSSLKVCELLQSIKQLILIFEDWMSFALTIHCNNECKHDITLWFRPRRLISLILICPKTVVVTTNHRLIRACIESLK